MPKRDAYDDDEVCAFVEAQPLTLTWSELADAVLARFGPERAWSRSKINRYCTGILKQKRRWKAARDPEIRVFIEERADRWTLDQIMSEGMARFGDRMPSKSSVHRYIHDGLGIRR